MRIRDLGKPARLSITLAWPNWTYEIIVYERWFKKRLWKSWWLRGPYYYRSNQRLHDTRQFRPCRQKLNSTYYLSSHPPSPPPSSSEYSHSHQHQILFHHGSILPYPGPGLGQGRYGWWKWDVLCLSGNEIDVWSLCIINWMNICDWPTFKCKFLAFLKSIIWDQAALHHCLIYYAGLSPWW